MIKTTKIKVKSIENEEIIIAMTNQQQQNTQKQQQHIVAPVYITDGDAIRKLL